MNFLPSLSPSLSLPRSAIPYSEVLIEKHWRSVTPRAVCDFFWDEVNKYPDKLVRDGGRERGMEGGKDGRK